MFSIILKTELTMHVFPKVLVYFLLLPFYGVFFSFIYFLISVFWPYPGDSSAFDFSLKSYMVNFLSHFSEMEKFKDNTHWKICLWYSPYCLLFIAAWGQTKKGGRYSAPVYPWWWMDVKAGDKIAVPPGRSFNHSHIPNKSFLNLLKTLRIAGKSLI